MRTSRASLPMFEVPVVQIPAGRIAASIRSANIAGSISSSLEQVCLRIVLSSRDLECGFVTGGGDAIGVGDGSRAESFANSIGAARAAPSQITSIWPSGESDAMAANAGPDTGVVSSRTGSYQHLAGNKRLAG